MTTRTIPSLICGCVPTVTRCPVAASLWQRVEERRAAKRGASVAEAEYAVHLRAGWEARERR